MQLLADALKNLAAVKEQEPLSRHTGFCTGGDARYMLFPDSVSSFKKIFVLLNRSGERYFIIGNGSNLLASDDGYDGYAVSTKAMSRISLAGDQTIRCEAGAMLSDVCRFAEAKALSGLEFAYGIPGTAGGAVYMNAGAYDGEVGAAVSRVFILEIGGEERQLMPEECGFGYRSSRFQSSGEVVLAVDFLLQPGKTGDIRARMNRIMRERAEKQPLDLPSCGSTFKRPDGAYAARLIDGCGLKGFSVGGAKVSEKHAGFIVNYDRATSADILRLINEIKRRVLEQTGYRLECEIQFLE